MSIKERLAVTDSLLREATALRHILYNPAYTLDERMDALRDYLCKGVDATETLMGKGWEQIVAGGATFMAAGTAALLVGEGRAILRDLTGRTAETAAMNQAGRESLEKMIAEEGLADMAEGPDL